MSDPVIWNEEAVSHLLEGLNNLNESTEMIAGWILKTNTTHTIQYTWLTALTIMVICNFIWCIVRRK